MKYLKYFESYNNDQLIDLETELNIVDTIRRDEIEGDVPLGAEYAMLSPKDFIQKFYKFDNVKFNDGTIKKIIKFYGEQGGWHFSSYNDRDSRDYKNLENVKFLKIID